MTETTAISAERRKQMLSRLLTELQPDAPLEPDEIGLIRWLSTFYRERDLTVATMADVLQRHREQREKRARQKNPLSDLLASTSPPSKKERKQTPAQKARRQFRDDALREYTELLVAAHDPDAVAQALFGDDFVAAFADRLEAFVHEVAKQVAGSLADRELSNYDRVLTRQERKGKGTTVPYEPPPRALRDAELNTLTKRLQTRIEHFAEGRREKYQLQTNIRALWAYYKGSFADLWDQAEETWREQAILQEVDLEPIFNFHRDEVLLYMRRYEGLWSVEEAREALRHSLDVLEDAVARRLEEERQYQRLVSLYQAHSDFASCFPVARSMVRKIEFFCGPTNSGKTHAAMNELADSESGVYLAPLRLLALEGQTNLQERGVAASFLTGEERDIDESASFVSSTIEMLDYDTPIETAIIDEIQLLGDPQRGWAWTNALVGVPAQRVILTGSADALPLIQAIGDYLNEEVEVRHFTRFNTLEPLTKPASVEKDQLRHLEPGTAIICFSRRDVLELKQHLESITEMKVSVIYGGLAPEVRREEARRFREREADLLVATDAISMGLNLPIRTVLFWQTYKRYNNEDHPLRDTEIKQIAGRAGRFGLEDRGYVGAFNDAGIERVAEALEVELSALHPPCLVMPLPFHIELIAQALHTRDIVYILRYFCERIWFEGDLFQPVVTEDMMMLARMLEDDIRDLPLSIQFTFVCAPVNMRANSVVQSHLDFAYHYGRGDNVPLPKMPLHKFRKGAASSSRELRDAEDIVHIATLYKWLSFRYGDAFYEADRADQIREIVNQYISRSLQNGRMARRCNRCDCVLPANHHFGICEACFAEQRKQYKRR